MFIISISSYLAAICNAVPLLDTKLGFRTVEMSILTIRLCYLNTAIVRQSIQLLEIALTSAPSDISSNSILSFPIHTALWIG